MEAEEVLLLIMKKLKEYKANPLRCSISEKARQKNLMKMFCIYTSMKKREQAKQRRNEQSMCKDKPTLLQKDSPDFKQTVTEEEILVAQSNANEEDDGENYVQPYESISLSNDSTHNRIDNLVGHSANVIRENDAEREAEVSEDCEQDEEYIDTVIQDLDSPTSASTSTILNSNNQRISDPNDGKSEECIKEYYEEILEVNMDEYKDEQSEQYIKEYNEEQSGECTEEYDQQVFNECTEKYNDQSVSIDGFLMQLGEGLRRLPYRQRSKLEIEFLARLYQVEECLGLLNN